MLAKVLLIPHVGSRWRRSSARCTHMLWMGSLVLEVQGERRILHPMTSVQIIHTSHDAPSDSNQSCQSISPSKLNLSDTTCSKSSPDRQSPPKSVKRKRAEEILEKKYAHRGRGGPAREMIGLSSRHENVGACSSSERSGCNM